MHSAFKLIMISILIIGPTLVVQGSSAGAGEENMSTTTHALLIKGNEPQEMSLDLSGFISEGHTIPRVVVNTSYGRIAGLRDRDGLEVFLGIPYARPPTGDLRFRPPREPEPWKNIRPAISFGPSPIQVLDEYELASAFMQDEDCLSLNVWTPGADDKRRRVLVFIHGGGFIQGGSSDPNYDGASFARRGDIVVVTINYRIGALGFLDLEHYGKDYAGSGNQGLLDQIAALRWVQKNIRNFGGDPGNVTIMGESAGSISVSTLMAVQEAKGLFKRAIAQSGAPNLCRSPEFAENVTERFMALAGTKDAKDLDKMDSSQILDIQKKLMKESGVLSDRLFAPVIDGKILPKNPLDAMAEGAAANVSLLHGTTRDEARFWLLYQPLLILFTPEDTLSLDPGASDSLGGRKDQVIGYYEKSYDGPGDAALAMATDILFWLPHIRMSEAQSPWASVWMYRFDWTSPCALGLLGAYHSVELPFVFGNYNTLMAKEAMGQNPPTELMKMQDSWIAFIRTGDPNIQGLPHWSSYNVTTRETMILDENSSAQKDPGHEARLLYKGTGLYP